MCAKKRKEERREKKYNDDKEVYSRSSFEDEKCEEKLKPENLCMHVIFLSATLNVSSSPYDRNNLEKSVNAPHREDLFWNV